MFDVNAGLMPILIEESDESSASSISQEFSKLNVHTDNTPKHTGTKMLLIDRDSFKKSQKISVTPKNPIEPAEK